MLSVFTVQRRLRKGSLRLSSVSVSYTPCSFADYVIVYGVVALGGAVRRGLSTVCRLLLIELASLKCS